jgi:uncharacterized small protein (DUF1192 family)
MNKIAEQLRKGIEPKHDVSVRGIEAQMKEAADEIDRLEAENADIRRWRALDKPLTAAMAIANSEIERLQASLDACADYGDKQVTEIGQLNAALDEIIALDHYPDATIARKALGLPTTDREEHKP